VQADASNASSDQDWRLHAELDVPDVRRSLSDLLGRLRGPAVFEEIEASVPHDVVITHDGKLLFAYAADKATLEAARSAIEGALWRDGIKASVRVSHWDDRLDDWLQIDPPPSAEQARAEDAAARDAEAIETRTLVASSGKLIRAEFERSMLDWAGKLGVECTLVEHPHLLTTQVCFTVSGPRRKVEEFSQGLTAEERRTIRTDRTLMLNPL
jgi:hypothetical protein